MHTTRTIRGSSNRATGRGYGSYLEGRGSPSVWRGVTGVGGGRASKKASVTTSAKDG